jgi:hypothetical protein
MAAIASSFLSQALAVQACLPVKDKRWISLSAKIPFAPTAVRGHGRNATWLSDIFSILCDAGSAVSNGLQGAFTQSHSKALVRKDVFVVAFGEFSSGPAQTGGKG